MISQRDIYLLDLSLKYRKKKKAAKMMLSEEEGGSWNSDRWGEQPQWYSFTEFRSNEALRLRWFGSGCCVDDSESGWSFLLLLLHAEFWHIVEMWLHDVWGLDLPPLDEVYWRADEPDRDSNYLVCMYNVTFSSISLQDLACESVSARLGHIWNGLSYLPSGWNFRMLSPGSMIHYWQLALTNDTWA